MYSRDCFVFSSCWAFSRMNGRYIGTALADILLAKFCTMWFILNLLSASLAVPPDRGIICHLGRSSLSTVSATVKIVLPHPRPIFISLSGRVPRYFATSRPSALSTVFSFRAPRAMKSLLSPNLEVKKASYSFITEDFIEGGSTSIRTIPLSSAIFRYLLI